MRLNYLPVLRNTLTRPLVSKVGRWAAGWRLIVCIHRLGVGGDSQEWEQQAGCGPACCNLWGQLCTPDFSPPLPAAAPRQPLAPLSHLCCSPAPKCARARRACPWCWLKCTTTASAGRTSTSSRVGVFVCRGTNIKSVATGLFFLFGWECRAGAHRSSGLCRAPANTPRAAAHGSELVILLP